MGATFKALLEEKAFESSFEVNSRNVVQYKQYREGSSKRKTYLGQKPGGSQVKSYLAPMECRTGEEDMR